MNVWEVLINKSGLYTGKGGENQQTLWVIPLYVKNEKKL